MVPEPFVYYQSATLWNPVQHEAIKRLAQRGLDAIIFEADSAFPTEGKDSLIPLIHYLTQQGVITIVHPKDNLDKEKTRRSVKAGAISIGTNTDEPLTLVAKVKKIINANSTPDSRRRAISAELFLDDWHPAFETDHHLTYINHGKIPHLTIIGYLNQLPLNSSIVINCGHIDNPGMRPDALSIEIFRQGVQALKYLEARSHRNVRLSVLVNDMYEFDKDPIAARKALDKRRRRYKATGVHDLFPREYREILAEYGIDLGRWPRVIIPKTETGLKFAATQALSSSQESSLLVDLVEQDGQLAYTIGTNDKQYAIPLTSKSGAPVCRAITSVFFKQLEDQGATNILHLYPLEHECSTVGGIKAARKLYGSNAAHQVFLFGQTREGIDIMRRDVA